LGHGVDTDDGGSTLLPHSKLGGGREKDGRDIT
jgi:hypothetical protein